MESGELPHATCEQRQKKNFLLLLGFLIVLTLILIASLVAAFVYSYSTGENLLNETVLEVNIIILSLYITTFNILSLLARFDLYH